MARKLQCAPESPEGLIKTPTPWPCFQNYPTGRSQVEPMSLPYQQVSRSCECCYRNQTLSVTDTELLFSGSKASSTEYMTGLKAPEKNVINCTHSALDLSYHQVDWCLFFMTSCHILEQHILTLESFESFLPRTPAINLL